MCSSFRLLGSPPRLLHVVAPTAAVQQYNQCGRLWDAAGTGQTPKAILWWAGHSFEDWEPSVFRVPLATDEGNEFWPLLFHDLTAPTTAATFVAAAQLSNGATHPVLQYVHIRIDWSEATLSCSLELAAGASHCKWSNTHFLDYAGRGPVAVFPQTHHIGGLNNQ